METKELGIIVRSEKSGDYDRYVTILTPSALLKSKLFGVRSGNKGTNYRLYTEGTFSISRNRGFCSVRDVDIISTHDYIFNDYMIARSASFMSALAVITRQSSPEFYNLYTKAIDSLESGDYMKVLAVFLAKFLRNEGICADWIHCPSCSKRFSDDEVLGFSVSDNVAVCSSCDTSAGTFILPPNARKYILAATNGDFQKALSFEVSDRQIKSIVLYLMRTVRTALPGIDCDIAGELND